MLGNLKFLEFHFPTMDSVSSPLYTHPLLPPPLPCPLNVCSYKRNRALTVVCTYCTAKQEIEYYKAANGMHAVIYWYTQGEYHRQQTIKRAHGIYEKANVHNILLSYSSFKLSFTQVSLCKINMQVGHAKIEIKNITFSHTFVVYVKLQHMIMHKKYDFYFCSLLLDSHENRIKNPI